MALASLFRRLFPGSARAARDRESMRSIDQNATTAARDVQTAADDADAARENPAEQGGEG